MVPCHRLIAVLAGGLLVLAGSGPLASGQAVDLKKLQAEARKQQELSFDRVRLLKGSFKMADVCQIVQENGQVVLKTNLPADARSGQVRLEIEGVVGTTLVSSNGRPDQPDKGWSFSLRNVRFDDPEAVQVDTTISAGTGYFSLSRTCRLPSGYRNVSVSQGRTFVAGQETAPIMMFNVNSSNNDGARPMSIYAQAADLPTLRRQRPKETEEYLRPVLRDLHLQCLLAVDPAVAWQVFASQWTPDEKVAAQVKELLPRLDADSFQEREAALKELQAKGKDAALVVYHMNRKALTPQQNMVLDAFLGPVLTLSPDEIPKMRADRDFLLDCLYSDQPEIRATALANLRKVVNSDLKFDAGETLQQRVAAVEELRATLAARPTSGPTTKEK